ncbi:hypothetical protein ACWEQL_00255 [Kitasatospora sp. NPDC004240]
MDVRHKIGLVAPSQVGKTTLIASLMRDAREMLNTPEAAFASLRSLDQRQSTGLSALVNQIEGSIQQGELRLQATPASIGIKTYELRLTAGAGGPAVVLDIMDYPGGLLTGDTYDQAGWQRVNEHIAASTLLLVPINAPAVMSAVSSQEKASLATVLALEEIRDLIEVWAKYRMVAADSEPGAVVFCPMRCESYFSDNYGRKDSSDELRARVFNAYGSIFSLVREIAPNVTVGYLPIDTLGCVEIEETRWESNPDTGMLDCRPTFQARAPYKLAPKAVRSLLVLVARLLMEDIEASAVIDVTEATELYRVKDDEANRRYFILRQLFRDFMGTTDALRTQAEERRREMTAARDRLGKLRETLEFLRNYALDSRYSAWKGKA